MTGGLAPTDSEHVAGQESHAISASDRALLLRGSGSAIRSAGTARRAGASGPVTAGLGWGQARS